MLAAEVAGRFGLNDSARVRKAGRWGVALLALIAVGLGVLYLRGMPERDVKSLLAEGQYAKAAKAADAYLARHPDDAPFQAMGTEALLRAYVPPWAGKLKAQDFSGAAAVLSEMASVSQHNADARPLVSELEWIGNLERYFAQRGGAEAPIRLYTDESTIRGLLTHWNQDTAAHQRALGRIAGFEPRSATSMRARSVMCASCRRMSRSTWPPSIASMPRSRPNSRATSPRHCSRCWPTTRRSTRGWPDSTGCRTTCGATPR